MSTRSGRIVIRGIGTDDPVVSKGDAVIGPDGVVSSSPHTAVEITCPEGTDVVVGSISGAVTCSGRLGRVAVTNRSGRVEVEHGDEVDVRTASGAISVDRCEGSCSVVTTSGRVRIGSAASLRATNTSGRIEARQTKDAMVRSASGRVVVGAVGGGRIEIEVIAGAVEVTLPAGSRPVMGLSSVSGRIRAANRSVADGHDGNEGDGVVVVTSMSGAITVTEQ